MIWGDVHYLDSASEPSLEGISEGMSLTSSTIPKNSLHISSNVTVEPAIYSGQEGLKSFVISVHFYQSC